MRGMNNRLMSAVKVMNCCSDTTTGVLFNSRKLQSTEGVCHAEFCEWVVNDSQSLWQRNASVTVGAADIYHRRAKHVLCTFLSYMIFSTRIFYPTTPFTTLAIFYSSNQWHSELKFDCQVRMKLTTAGHTANENFSVRFTRFLLRFLSGKAQQLLRRRRPVGAEWVWKRNEDNQDVSKRSKRQRATGRPPSAGVPARGNERRSGTTQLDDIQQRQTVPDTVTQTDTQTDDWTYKTRRRTATSTSSDLLYLYKLTFHSFGILLPFCCLSYKTYNRNSLLSGGFRL